MEYIATVSLMYTYLLILAELSHPPPYLPIAPLELNQDHPASRLLSPHSRGGRLLTSTSSGTAWSHPLLDTFNNKHANGLSLTNLTYTTAYILDLICL